MVNTHNKTPTKKPKLVRDSFTIPKAEFMVIEEMKKRAIALGTTVKKSELLRAGLKVLQRLNDSDYKAALAAVPTLKTGRPSSEEQGGETPKTVTAKTAVKATPKVSTKPATQAARKSIVKPAVKQPAKRAPATQTAVTKAPVAAKAAKPLASTKSVVKSTPASKVATSVEAAKPAMQAPTAETPT